MRFYVLSGPCSFLNGQTRCRMSYACSARAWGRLAMWTYNSHTFVKNLPRWMYGTDRPLAEFTAQLESQRDNLRWVLLNELKSARYLDLIRHLQQAKQEPIGIETTITLYDLEKNAFR